MVIDDSSIVRGFLTSFLETYPGIKVTEAVPNGQAALPLLLAAKPTLPIIVASTKTRENVALALKCLCPARDRLHWKAQRA